MKILMICNTDGALYNFRKPIIEELIKQKHEVHSITSSRSPEGSYIEKLETLGVKTHIVEFDKSVGIIKNFKLFMKISKEIKSVKPEIVHNFTHKPAIYGSIAAKLNRVDKVFVSITGLGNLFTNKDFKTKILKWVLLLQYKIASSGIDAIFFQNPDDQLDFIRKKIIRRNKTALTPGSGINLKEFNSSEQEKKVNRQKLSEEINLELENKLVFLCPARALIEKGTNDYYKAAGMVNLLSNDYVFLHLGSESEQEGMDKESLMKKAKENNVHFLGFKSNIKDYMIASDVVILPSYYREGVPRSLLESLALDKIIITTNRPGCKETVLDDWNGKLCIEKNHKNLAGKILSISNKNKLDYTGRSRAFAENFFDSKIIVDMTLKQYFKE